MPARRLRLPPSVFKQLSRTVLPLVETWVGAGQGMIECTSTVEDTFVQEFQRGAAVRPHVHDIDESVLTAVINIAQIGVSASGSRRPRVLHRCQSGIEFVRALAPVLVGMDEQWPIRVNDHSGKQHELYLAPGDILLRVTMPPPISSCFPACQTLRDVVFDLTSDAPTLRHEGARLVTARPFALRGEKYVQVRCLPCCCANEAMLGDNIIHTLVLLFSICSMYQLSVMAHRSRGDHKSGGASFPPY